MRANRQHKVRTTQAAALSVALIVAFAAHAAQPDGQAPAARPAHTAAPPTEGDNPNLHSDSRPVNGIDVTIQVLWSDAKMAKEAIDAVFSELRRVQRKLTTNGRFSEIRSVNRHADTEEVFLSSETFGLVQKALHLCRLSERAFDPTVQSFSYLWNFNHRPFVRPLKDEVASRGKSVGCDKVILKPNRAMRVTAPRMRISLQDMINGHMLSRASDVLMRRGISNYRVSVGRDMYAHGRVGSRHWYMSVGHPNKASKEMIQLYVGSHAIATRSWSDRYTLKGGKRYHDVIDPRRGSPAAGVAQATVVSTDPVLADALSAAIFVLGPRKGVALLNKIPQAEGFIIDDTGRVTSSRGMTEYGRLPERIKL